MIVPAARATIERARRLVHAIDWSSFPGDAWGRRPAVLRGALPAPLVRPEDIFHVLVECRNDLARGEACEVTLYDQKRVAYSGSSASDRSVSPLAPLLPRARERDLDTYFSRLREHPSFERFALFINQVHEFEVPWLSVREVVAALGSQLALPQTSLNTDVFIGNYEKTTFGAHRDALDNLLFMLRGRRTLRLWSDRDFRRVMGDCDEDDTFVDYERALPASTAFELREGDVLYWPADHWHVGEGGDDISISLNLDFPIPDADERIPEAVRRAVQRTLDGLAREQPDARRPERVSRRPIDLLCARSEDLLRIDRCVESFRASVSSRSFEREVAREYLRWMTAAGFGEVPPPLDAAALPRGAFVEIDAAHPLACAEVGDRLVIAAGGHALEVPAARSLIELVQLLNEGQPLLADELEARHSGPSVTSGGKRLEIEAEAIRWLLGALARFRGLFVRDVAADTSGAAPGRDRWRVVSQRELEARDASEAAAILAEYGVAVVPDVLDAAMCAALDALIKPLRTNAAAELQGDIHESRRRFDIPVPLDATVRVAVEQVVRRLLPVWPDTVGPDAAMVELSSLTSFPGAKAQIAHPDSQFGSPETAAMVTVFVPLATVHRDQGPLHVWPRTHASRFFEWEELKREALSPEREVEILAPAGAAILMDSRTWHRGGANRSTRPRPMFYTSWLGAGDRPEGPTYTLRPELRDRFRLRDFMDGNPAAATHAG